MGERHRGLTKNVAKDPAARVRKTSEKKAKGQGEGLQVSVK